MSNSKTNSFFWIYQINKDYLKLAEEKKNIRTGGRVKNIRKSKDIIFLDLSNGVNEYLHVLIMKKKLKFDFNAINIDSFISLTGFIKLVNRIQKYEFVVKEIDKLSINDYEGYPIQKKKSSLEFVRQFPQFKGRTKYFSTIFYFRSLLTKIIENFFYDNHFFKVNTPLLTKVDTEGAGETFFVFDNFSLINFLKQKENDSNDTKGIAPESVNSTDNIKLTVSSQLHLEVMAQNMERVFNFSPCFRAEKSKTTRHLSEFWMLEIEMLTSDVQDLISICQRLLKYLSNYLLKEEEKKLKFLESYLNYPLINFLETIISEEKFMQIKYSEVLDILYKHDMILPEQKNKVININFSQEKYICDYFEKKPIFVLNYPKKIKPFYMKDGDKNKEEVVCFDLLLPNVGEVIGGSIREDDFLKLKEKSLNSNLDISKMDWYLNIRKAGYSTSGGFGIGFERLMMFLFGIPNIQDTVTFPLSYNLISKNYNF